MCKKQKGPTLGVRFREVSNDVNFLYKRIDFRLLFTTQLYLACVQKPAPLKKKIKDRGGGGGVCTQAMLYFTKKKSLFFIQLRENKSVPLARPPRPKQS